MEIWKDVVGYERTYEVSSYGRIRRKESVVACKGNSTRVVKARDTKVFVSRTGYNTVVLCQDGVSTTYTVHQVVAQAHIPGFVKSTELNHKDGVKTNNRVDNLEVSNPSHNQLHAVRIGLVPKQGKSQYNNVTYITNPRAVSKWAGSIRHEGKSTYGWKTFKTEEEAARHVDALLDSIGCTSRLRNFPLKCPTTNP